MKLGIIGATGKLGQLITKEAVDRGFDVTAIVRNKAKVTNSDVAVLEKDLFDLTQNDLKDFDVIVNAFGAPLGEEQIHVDAGNVLIEAVKGTDVLLIVVGGAGSLFVDEEKTTRLLETPEFPEIFKPTAVGSLRNLEILEKTTDVTWTFLSPAADFDYEGKRTGAYQLGKDHVIVNTKGDSYISYADYAIAIVDEVEQGQFINTRFTVVGEVE
ncbi:MULTISPECIES: NAD(P)-dependent oxidoreductase [unclassified Staphylococcus]|uniref:NAD(P)-dependent oxidoreductase n=1 Tax=unclassified Staphylococcus TaxID=91994 RepID=UPI0021D31011|nr:MULTISPECIES: NAD(P)-dependent oxidoreductase [unclassified Staphylococcus]UXR73805.1 NAD(P)-dependent oxidoreductase [Staphylococcus sp. IVB6238]UXR76124.1 NAD(P)-dependent oxidoreductase [Staphylococcus sp. IVB6233]UXR80321.1 NAD(P)-dependent oxidoreductase [Staphylococcus sp. IVB6218]